MTILEAMQARHAVRSYKDKKIEESVSNLFGSKTVHNNIPTVGIYLEYTLIPF